MIKYSKLLLAALILFLLVNTTYFWQRMLGTWALLVTIILAILVLTLILSVCYQAFFVATEGFNNKPRLYSTSLTAILLLLVFLRPFGMINFENFEGRDLFVAQREGVGHCVTWLKLKEDKSCWINSVCFGINDRNCGKYTISGDTVKFNFLTITNINKQYKFGIFKKDAHSYNKAVIGEIRFYGTEANASGKDFLYVVKNDLIR